jgi:hypothetical protein
MEWRTVVLVTLGALPNLALLAVCLWSPIQWALAMRPDAAPAVAMRPGAAPAVASRPSVPKGDMTMKVFKTQRPTGPIKLVCVAKLDHYWNCEYRGCEYTHYSLGLSPQGVSAWVAKDTEAGRRLYELLKDGGEKLVFVEAGWMGPDGRPTRPGDAGVLITGVWEP